VASGHWQAHEITSSPSRAVTPQEVVPGQVPLASTHAVRSAFGRHTGGAAAAGGGGAARHWVRNRRIAPPPPTMIAPFPRRLKDPVAIRDLRTAGSKAQPASRTPGRTPKAKPSRHQFPARLALPVSSRSSSSPPNLRPGPDELDIRSQSSGTADNLDWNSTSFTFAYSAACGIASAPSSIAS
jgi:hypothetical protein